MKNKSVLLLLSIFATFNLGCASAIPMATYQTNKTNRSLQYVEGEDLSKYNVIGISRGLSRVSRFDIAGLFHKVSDIGNEAVELACNQAQETARAELRAEAYTQLIVTNDWLEMGCVNSVFPLSEQRYMCTIVALRKKKSAQQPGDP